MLNLLVENSNSINSKSNETYFNMFYYGNPNGQVNNIISMWSSGQKSIEQLYSSSKHESANKMFDEKDEQDLSESPNLVESSSEGANCQSIIPNEHNKDSILNPHVVPNQKSSTYKPYLNT